MPLLEGNGGERKRAERNGGATGQPISDYRSVRNRENCEKTEYNRSMRHHPLLVARAERGLSQADLGRLTGLSDSAISRIERGGTPHAANQVRIARALGVRAEDIFLGAPDRVALAS
ncbi:MAG: Helix-turn-helix domain [Solirubrobacterales bacterium]|nr:Helix-turn-helix domain [Solirubrobacterales bacterium]